MSGTSSDPADTVESRAARSRQHGTERQERSERTEPMHASALVENDSAALRLLHGRAIAGGVQIQTDEDLLRQCASGRADALEELVRRYQTPLYRFLARLTGSTEDAQDAVLEVFVKAWQHAPRFEYRARVATWLYRIAVNIARDAHSRRKARPTEPLPEAHQLPDTAIGSAEEDALHNLEQEQRSAVLQRCLRRLSDSDRVLLVLYYIEEREYDEIQAITGLSYTVLKTRLARARKRLRDLLAAAEAGMGR